MTDPCPSIALDEGHTNKPVGCGEECTYKDTEAKARAHKVEEAIERVGVLTEVERIEFAKTLIRSLFFQRILL
jgi:hypothetical protein